MTSLKGLFLDNNQITGKLPTFDKLQNVFYLHFDNNELSGSLPPSLWQLPNLWSLHLEGNMLSGFALKLIRPKNHRIGASKKIKHKSATVLACGTNDILNASQIAILPTHAK